MMERRSFFSVLAAFAAAPWLGWGKETNSPRYLLTCDKWEQPGGLVEGPLMTIKELSELSNEQVIEMDWFSA